MSGEIADAPELLQAMLRDSGSVSEFWRPTAYWRGYANRINREIRQSGLGDLRVNQELLKGFARGGAPRPARPASAWKRGVWSALVKSPGVRRIVSEYERVLRAEYRHQLGVRIRHARVVLEEIAERFPDIRPPDGIANGGAEDAFEWRDWVVTEHWVEYLARVADFYSEVPPSNVRSILEIGPGLGLTTLAHMAINPNLEIAINVDIAPIAYLSTQFLKSVPAVETVDYLKTRGTGRIEPETGPLPVVYQMLPWQMPSVGGNVDFAFNAFSFQEMEPDICRNYSREMCRLATGGVLVHSTVIGHAPGAGGQKDPVTMEFLASLFSANYSAPRELDGFWPKHYAGSPENTALFLR